VEIFVGGRGVYIYMFFECTRYTKAAPGAGFNEKDLHFAIPCGILKCRAEGKLRTLTGRPLKHPVVQQSLRLRAAIPKQIPDQK